MSKIITFEGIDGSGKTTLASALREHYGAAGKVVWQTSEPWSFASYRIDPDPFIATMQLMADRRKHCQALKDTLYDIALIDRFDLSTKAYQGYGDGVDRDIINALNAVATEGVDVSLRIWLHLPVEMAVERIERRGEKVSEAEVWRLWRIQSGYATMAEWRERRMVGECEAIQRIDATQPPDAVMREAIALIEEIL